MDAALASGGQVLVHCLAGAHRAGTTGCMLLMYKLGVGAEEATRTAKALRSVINPIGGLPELLRMYERMRPSMPTTTAAVTTTPTPGGTATAKVTDTKACATS